MGVTIKDIAKILNISHTTVSRALNDSPLINDATKAKIKALAKDLNYVPNFNAKSLVTSKSFHIGLFFSTIQEKTSQNFFYETVKGVNQMIGEHYNLIVKSVDQFHNDFTRIDPKRYDGIILMSQSEQDNPFIYDVLNKKIPLVVLNRDMEDSRFVNILSADRKGAYEAVHYLITMGHRNIGLIEGTQEFKASQERKEGYIRAFMDSKLPMDQDIIVQGNYTMESGYAAMQQLLQMNNRPTAVFCCNDEMAVGAMKAITDAGLRIPEDMSMIGFDDSPFSSFITPSLTTVRRSIDEVSRIGAKKLLQLVEQNEPVSTGEKMYIQTELIERDSVASLKP